MNSTPLPAQAQVIVIGGGIAGCSTAYHLAKQGVGDVVVIEKGQLTSGSTWHAAGLVGQLRASANITRLLQYSVDLYQSLEALTGLSTGWKSTGSIRLCCTKDRRIEIERQVATARSYGIDAEFLSPGQIAELCPAMSTTGIDSGVYISSDGNVNPSDLTQALARGARQLGVKFIEHTTVLGITLNNHGVSGIETSSGSIDCEQVAICAGLWSREIAHLAGANIPLIPSFHQYMVTEPIEGIVPGMPGIRDPDRLTYFKEEVGGLAAGGYELNPVPYDGKPSADDPDFRLFPEMTDHFAQFMPGMVERFPQLESVGIKRWFRGLESFTEDTHFILGELPEVRGLFCACGFNAMGIAAGGGAGMALAQWMRDGESPFDLWPVDIRRFSAYHRSDRQLSLRVLEGQGHHYAMHWPHFEFQAGRPLRRSALYDRLKASGACFGSKSGWERANWFARDNKPAVDTHTFGRPEWHDAVGAEHTACRECVALFDQSSFVKMLITGLDAESLLQRLCATDVAVAPGTVRYAPMLDRHGGIACDLTVARLSPTDYYLVSGTAMATHDIDHIARHIRPAENVSVVDITSGYGVLGLMGPQSRTLLQRLAESDLGRDVFPFGTMQEVMIAGAPVRVLRISFVGELGYELHVPTEYLLTVFDTLHDAGVEHGLVNAGYRAIDSLRLEKQFCAWGAEIGPDHSLLEAGLGFAVDQNKADFVGRDAVYAQRSAPLKKKLATFTITGDQPLLGGETIYRDGEVVGWITSGGFAHSFVCPVGLGYVRREQGVDTDYLASGCYELDVAGTRFPAEISLRALYDPTGARMRS
ncbi:MAG TPA: FAD-dependent oxidoreductase [Gammaproteobacteria bacterium]|nr:FAD-dependent oxidoreductase [Gammaproteobacteria bacterium]